MVGVVRRGKAERRVPGDRFFFPESFFFSDHKPFKPSKFKLARFDSDSRACSYRFLSHTPLIFSRQEPLVQMQRTRVF